MNINACRMSLRWSQEISDELICVFGEKSASFGVDFDISPYFGIYVSIGDLISFTGINSDHYKDKFYFIENIDQNSKDVLEYLDIQEYSFFKVAEEGRMFTYDNLYISLEIYLNNSVNITFDDSRREFYMKERAKEEALLRSLEEHKRNNPIIGFDGTPVF